MTKSDKSSAIAALIILLLFGIGGYFLPTIILWVGEFSPWVSGLIAAGFILAFFAVFWMRGRKQSHR